MIKKLFNKYQTFFSYLLSGGICFIIDILLFNILKAIFKNTTNYIIYATICARIISSTVNYLLNRNKVFKLNDTAKIDKFTFFKYFVLVITQMFISAYTVNFFYHLININESIIKIIVDSILCIINFFIQKKSIFITKKKKSKYHVFLLAIITTIAILYQPIDTNEIIKINYQNNVLLSFVLATTFYLYYNKYQNLERRKSFSILSFFLTSFLIIGYSIQNTGSLKVIIDDIQYIGINLIKYLGYYSLINLSLNVIFYYLEKIHIKSFKETKIVKLFRQNPFIFSIIILSIIYLIYLIAYYPGIVGYDPSYQIKEVMGIPNFYSESAGINGSFLLTAYNPIIHTLLIGYLFKVGLLIGNANFGIFLYTLIQMSFMVFVLSYSIKFLHQEHVPTTFLLIILGIYTFVPIFPFYSLSAFKDTYFALFFILYIIELCKLIKYDYQKKDIIKLIMISCCLFLFRHNGILTFLLSMPFFLILPKKKKKVLIIILSVLAIFFIYNGLISYFNITPTSRREILSIPLQQTARLVTYKETMIDDNDKEIINNIIDYNSIKEKYNPELSDPIKNTFKNESTNEDLINYLKVWFKYLLKEPRIYLEATLNNMYGYFYPNTQNWYFYHQKYNVLNDAGFDYHYNNLDILRHILYGYGEIFAYIPFLNLFVNIGITTWIYFYLTSYLMETKNKKYILLLLPAFSIILCCILGPVNTYYRYVIPYSFSLPTILGFIYINKKTTKV